MNDLTDKIKQLDNLRIGEGIQYLLNEGCKILGNPILTHDMGYRVIAYTENVETGDPIWVEFAKTGTVSDKWMVFFKEEAFIDVAANAKKVTFMTSNKLKYNRIFGKLLNRDNIQIGSACMVESNIPFEADDFELFEYFCDVLNKELAGSEYYLDYGQEYQEYLIAKLIEGSIEDKETYAAHIESIYMNLKTDLYIVVSDISKCRYISPADLRDLLKNELPDFKYSIYGGHIIIIISTDNGLIDIKKDLSKLESLCKQNNMYSGMSNRFDNLYRLRESHLEAVSALNYVLENNNEQYIFLYDDMPSPSV